MDKKTAILSSKNTILKLRILAKEKESIRQKLEVTAGALRLKAKQLAVVAKEKESVRRKLAVTVGKFHFKAEQLAGLTARKKAILASIGDAVMACDKEGLVTLFNRKAVMMTGFSSKEVIGKHYNHFIKFVREIDNKPSQDFIAEAMKTGHRTVMADNTLLIRKNGLKIPVADSAEPIRYAKGELIGCVIVFRDITHEKETDKAKSEFISVASHQLKTPATIVSLYTEMLLNGTNGVVTPKQKEYINEIRAANQRMIDIINTLLNVSRIEMGIFSVDPAPVDVIDILRNSIKESHTNLEAKHLVIHEVYHQEKHIIPIDKLLLSMVFSNLLSNSIRYTPAGGTISVKSIIKGDSLLISVSDSGCGIPINQQDKVFTKFFRADNARSEHTAGTGLGLYIVKSTLDHIGGEVWFSSKEKEGSIFSFTVPLIRRKIILNNSIKE